MYDGIEVSISFGCELLLFLFDCISAKIDVNVDFTHKLCTSLMFPAFRFAPIKIYSST